MLLVTSNSQGELTALERGMHALRSEMDVKAYAASVSRPRQTVDNEVRAARVATAVPDIGHDLSSRFSQLVEIHAAPEWLWRALVAALLEKRWTVEQTRSAVAWLKDLPSDDPALEWLSGKFSAGSVAGTEPAIILDLTALPIVRPPPYASKLAAAVNHDHACSRSNSADPRSPTKPAATPDRSKV
jgi:ParB-like chromosome segregation protein Spo0J